MFRGRSEISGYGTARPRRSLWAAGRTAVTKTTNSFRDKVGRHIARDRHNPDLRRRAWGRHRCQEGAHFHAAIKSGEPGRKDPSLQSRGCRYLTSQNVLACRPGLGIPS